MSVGRRLLLGTVGACALMNGFEVVAKSVRADFVVRNMEEVGVPPRALTPLAAVEGAGTVGLLVGLLGSGLQNRSAVMLGEAAAGGLVAFFVGAVITHLRARVLHNIGFPAVFLALASAALLALRRRAAELSS